MVWHSLLELQAERRPLIRSAARNRTRIEASAESATGLPNSTSSPLSPLVATLSYPLLGCSGDREGGRTLLIPITSIMLDRLGDLPPFV